MLSQFREIDFIWDKATKTFIKEIRVASSDEHGRKMTVQIVNDGQVEDLTGSSLSLYWITKDEKHQGLDLFTPIDVTQGIYELYFTTGMLSNIGSLRSNLHLIDSVGAISSEPFTITVFQAIDGEAVQASDSFSALTEMHGTLNEIRDAEISRVTAENNRIAAETIRTTSENDRVTAEEARQSNEVTRKTNETARTSAETSRESAETTRSTNESTRVSNEDVRIADEASRIAAESERATNENTRTASEIERITSENERVIAENERAEGYPTLDSRLTTVEQNIDLVKFHTVRKLYDNTTTVLANAVKREWASLELNDAENPASAYLLRVSGSRYGLAIVGKVDNSNGTMLVIGISGGDYHTLTNGNWT